MEYVLQYLKELTIRNVSFSIDKNQLFVYAPEGVLDNLTKSKIAYLGPDLLSYFRTIKINSGLKSTQLDKMMLIDSTIISDEDNESFIVTVGSNANLTESIEEISSAKANLFYWENKLADMPENLDLATDFARPKVQSFAGAVTSFKLDKKLTEQLNLLAEKRSTTLYMLLLALFKVLLFRYSGQQDICVGSPIANRQYGETEELIGMFVNTLAMRSQLTADSRFVDFLEQVKQTCLQAYEYQDTPFEKVVEAVQPNRNMAISPLFQVMLILQNTDSQSGNPLFNPFELNITTSKFDMTLEFIESEQGLNCQVEYATALYQRETIQRLGTHFVGLSQAVVNAPDLKLCEYSYLSEKEQTQLLVDFNQTQVDYPKGICLHQLFINQAAQSPDAIAAVCHGETLTYQQLLEKSQTLAFYLQAQGVEPDSLVGICVQRSLDMLVGILAILQAGGAYVALDPEYPRERLAYILQDSQARILLTQQTLVEELNTLIGEQTQLLAFDQAWSEISDYALTQKAKGEVLVERVEPNHLAYVIYTSGSTGQPKGVAIEHHSPVTLVHWAREVYGEAELAGVLGSTSLCFDLSIYEIFVTLSSGGKVIVVANALGLCELEDKESVSLINTVPSAIEELLRLNGIPETVKTINLAGEPLSSALVDRIYASSEVEKVYDLYGPSEDTTYSTFSLRKQNGNQTIGRPLANTQVYILDKSGNLQPVGMPGELHIGGEGLARGYLHQTELTEEKFIRNDLAPGGRLYRTGDLARWLSDGTIEYLGRIDTQVKVRGFRIEIGEIESQFLTHQDVKDCAVVAQEEGSDKQLIGFYVIEGSGDGRGLKGEVLREHLQQHLPDYMLPAAFVELKEIPLMPNGKINRRVLVEMEVSFEASASYQAARNETEQMLVDIWAQVLGLETENTGVYDNFFELGGHSLLATRVRAKVRRLLKVDLPLKSFFEKPTINQLAKRIIKSGAVEYIPLKPVNRKPGQLFPLSYAQERISFLDLLESDSASYNIPFIARFNQQLSVSLIEKSLDNIVKRHEILRTIFLSDNGITKQKIQNSFKFKLKSVDLTSVENTQEALNEAMKLCRFEAKSPFKLESGPLIRGLVVLLAKQKNVLLLNLHHIISDGWSMGVLIKELGQVINHFQNNQFPLPEPLAIQYIDYSVWQRRVEDKEKHSKTLNYWKEQLEGVPESIDFALDYSRPPQQDFNGKTFQFSINRHLTASLNKVSKTNQSTLYMTLLAVLKVLLYRYTAKSDICVGSPVANRQFEELENLIGMFVNTLAIRNQLNGKESFLQTLKKIKKTCLSAFEHQDTAFEKVVEVVSPNRSMAFSPLFQVMIILQNLEDHTTSVDGDDYLLEFSQLENETSKFDMTFEFVEHAESLTCSIRYATALYKTDTIKRLAEHFINLSNEIVSNLNIPLDELSFIGREERHKLLTEFNNQSGNSKEKLCIHQLFIQQVHHNPNKVALVCDGRVLSFQQVYEQAYHLGLYLQSLGVAPDKLVGLCVERTPELVIGILGIFIAGGAYVALDPESPESRLKTMLTDSNPSIVLTQNKFKRLLSTLAPEKSSIISIDCEQSIEEFRTVKNTLNCEVKSDNLAYVIYTSGTTGTPKGVMIEHGMLVDYCYSAFSKMNLNDCESFASFSTFAADLGNTALFLPLVFGKTIHLLSNDYVREPLEFVKYLERLPIDCIKLTPSHYEMFKVSKKQFVLPEKVVIFAGEPLTKDIVEEIKESKPSIRVFNNYGPTETTIAKVISSDLTQVKIDKVYLGKPFCQSQIYILNQNKKLQPIGVAGEIYIAGDGVSRGYLNRSDLTRKCFYDNPFMTGSRIYKTGDLGRWNVLGEIEYLGRMDTQVNIRGFRIETSEIEVLLERYQEISSCAVVVQGAEPHKHLVAFYLASESIGNELVELDSELIRSYLQNDLPDYMLPAAFVSVKEIPLTENGKVNRRQLENIKVNLESNTKYVAATNAIELELVEIWSEVLNRAPESIGVNDNFFELGGHSLLATRVISKIRTRLKIEIPLKSIFIQKSLRLLGMFIAEAEKNQLPLLSPVKRDTDKNLPLSFVQERLWFLDQLDPDTANYNIPIAYLFKQKIDFVIAQKAFKKIICRHENLRTSFPCAAGKAYLNIHHTVKFKLERVDLSQSNSYQEAHVQAKNVCQSIAETPFCLSQGPLIKAALINLPESSSVLMFNMHHIISDGWSTGIFIKEFVTIIKALYAGTKIDLPKLSIQYADYGVWQRHWLESNGLLQKQLDYWQQKLADMPENLDLATDFARPKVQSFAGAVTSFKLDKKLTEQLNLLAEKRSTTLYMLLLALFKVLLFRYSGQQDICVGSPIANRQYGETEELIGMFVNTLAMRSQLTADSRFVDFLEQVKQTCLQAYEYQDTPFEKVVEAVQPNRNMAISPLFQVMLILQNTDSQSGNPLFNPFELNITTSKFDMTLEFIESEQGLNCQVEYATALYQRETIQRLGTHFVGLSQAVVNAPDLKLCEYSYLSEKEQTQLLVDFNQTQVDYPKGICLHQLFINQAAQSPDAIAAVCHGETLTYQQLLEKSQTLAFYLQAQGVEPDSLVGICVQRSLDMLVGILAILQAGGAYVALDPEYPRERLAYILQDSQARILLTQQTLVEELNTLIGEQTQLLAFDQAWSEISDYALTQKAKGEVLVERVEPNHLAYVIYTSGSTGQPKGVAIEHHSPVTLVHWAREVYGEAELAGVLGSTSLCFDLSIYEIFVTLSSGGKVIVVANALGLCELEDKESVSLINTVPSAIEELLRLNGIPETVKTINLAGEPLSSALVDRIYASSEVEKVYDLYGPSEDTTYSTFSLRKQNGNQTIGRPLANTQVYILDKSGNLQPVGMPGELHIGGEGLARGYLHQTELTEEKFIRNDLAPGGRLYRTGDLARWLSDGTIEYLGRIDTQVKVRGFRIEIGEIESQFLTHQDVKDCAVVAQEEGSDKQLIGFYVIEGSGDGRGLKGEVLREHLQQHLPDYMLPAAFVELKEIPLMPNGKINRRVLVEMEVSFEASASYQAARNETEQMLVDIWAQVLGLETENTGVYDNFFELGGHSLLATQLLSKIRTELNVDLPLKAIFNTNTVAGIAEIIDAITRQNESYLDNEIFNHIETEEGSL